MKILFLTRWYPPYAGIFVERHARAVALYNNLTVLAILPGETVRGLTPQVDHMVDQPGYSVIRYFYRPSRCRIRVVAGTINLARFLIRALAGYRYVSKQYGKFDLIHVHILTRTAVLPFLLNRLQGIPYIISEHWTRYLPDNWGFNGFLRRTITRYIVRRAAAVTTVSGFLKTAMQDCGLDNKNFTVIPNCIDTRLFTRSGPSRPSERKRIIHVSNFHERAKNIRGILRVIKILWEQRQDFEMLFIGGYDPALGDAKRYASQLGLASPCVEFAGPLPAEKLAEAYRGSSFLLMFSNFESFSIVIPEALSCGIPVLAAAAGGIPEYFSAGTGRLILPGDENELLVGLNFMLDNSQSFDRGFMESFTENRFGQKQVGAMFDELYRSVANRNRRV
jgi:glycosyltransferase involved in cell wall biosynthesis